MKTTANVMMNRFERMRPATKCGAFSAMMTVMLLATAGPEVPAFGEEPCMPQWSDEFPSGGGVSGGPNPIVRALGQFDNGTGPALFVGGHFNIAGYVPANLVAKWNGHEWSSAPGLGIEQTGIVNAFAEFDDGTGPAIYAGGFFTEAGGKPAANIARWDGDSWSPVGLGVNAPVLDLVVYDDGSGPALIAAGTFTEAGGEPANRIAKWDGKTWSPLGGGFDSQVSTLAIINDGDGQTLIAGGFFTETDGKPASHIAQWDSSQWLNMGAGFDDTVNALTIIEDGGDSTLIAGGSFSQSGMWNVHRVAQWEGTSWQPLVGHLPITGAVSSLAYGDIGDGPTLYAGVTSHVAGIPTRIAEWTGEAWLPLGEGVWGSTRTLAIVDDVTGPVLYAGGNFGPQMSSQPIRWTGEHWLPIGHGLNAAEGWGTFSMAFFRTDEDEHLYAGGGFTNAGDIGPTTLARWDGQEWSSIGSLTGPSSGVNPTYAFKASDVYLYVGGAFQQIDGQPFNHIARWDGSEWSPLGGGVSEGRWLFTSVFAIEEFDDGSGPMLVVGGSFSMAGDVQASNIAAWDGENWHALGSGTNGIVNHMVVFDDGNGPSLYISGDFDMAGEVESGGLARWDGSQWHNVGSITASHWAHAPLAVHHGKLIVGDTVTLPGGGSYGPVAVFDGQSWTEWSEGYDALPGWFETFDDGTGPALYSGVFVPEGADEPMRALLKWDGSQWVVPDVGGVGIADGEEQNNTIAIIAMAVSSDGERLAVGGHFHFAGDTLSPHVAILEGCPALTPGDLNGDGVVNGADLLILFSAWGPCPDPDNCPADLNGDGVVDGADLLLLLANWG